MMNASSTSTPDAQHHPLVSIILPTYNRLHFLPDAIATVLAQSCVDWELIVIDDGSTDGTVDYLNELAASESRIRPLLREHTGNIAWLRNEGLAVARGSYLAFIDSDDLWDDSKLEVQLDALRSTPSARWSCSRFRGIDPDGNYYPLPARIRRLPRTGFILERMLRHEVAISVPAVMLERSLIDEVGMFDDSLELAEDIHLWLRIAAVAECIAVDDHLATIRVHQGQTTRNRGITTSMAMLDVLDRFSATQTDPRILRLVRRLKGRFAFESAMVCRSRRQPGEMMSYLVRSLYWDPSARAIREWIVDNGMPRLRRLFMRGESAR